MIALTRSQFLLGGAAALLAAPARAQPAWPARPSRMLVPFAPGGIVDFIARAVAQGMAEVAGQPVVVENRPGGSGIVAGDATAKAAPDGYTLFLTDPSVAVNPAQQQNLPFDVLRDLRPVAIVSSSPLVAVVPASLPVRTLQELAEHGRRNRGQLLYVSPGTGTMTHLAGEIFSQRAGIEATAVAYRGVGVSFPDLLAGRVHYVWSGIPTVAQMIETGQLRALATSGAERASSLPNVPTAVEAGFPDFVVDLWTGILVPAATPDSVVARIAAVTQEALGRPDTRTAMERAGAAVRFLGPAEANAFLRREVERWAVQARSNPPG